jgi:hypothetical protein
MLSVQVWIGMDAFNEVLKFPETGTGEDFKRAVLCCVFNAYCGTCGRAYVWDDEDALLVWCHQCGGKRDS